MTSLNIISTLALLDGPIVNTIEDIGMINANGALELKRKSPCPETRLPP